MPPRSRARSRCHGRALAAALRPASAATTPGTCPLSRHGVARRRSAARARAASIRTRADAELGRSPRSRHPHLRGRDAAHVQPDVDPVEERAAEPPEVSPSRRRHAGAVGVPRSVVAARARVRGEHQLETRGEARRSVGPRDRDDAGLERLPQGIERGRAELRRLVEEEHAVGRTRGRAGTDEPAAAADDRRRAGGVMRRLERRPAHQLGADRHADQRTDGAHLQRRDGIQIRQQRRQPRGEHRLAGAGWPEQVDVVPARRRDLHGLHRIRVADHIGEVAGSRRAARRARPASAERSARAAARRRDRSRRLEAT